MPIVYKPVAIIIDDFTTKSLVYDNVSLYDAGYTSTSDLTLSYLESSNYSQWISHNPSDNTVVQHGDWVLDAYISQLDSAVEVILIDYDIDPTDGYFDDTQTDLLYSSIIDIIDGWTFNHNTDSINYFPSVVSASFGNGASTLDPTLKTALSSLMGDYAVIVQSVPNVNQEIGANFSWGDSLADVINVGAYNIDSNNYSLFGSPADLAVIDVLADGYIEHVGWVDGSRNGWNFGTSFATPRVSAEITNLWVGILDDINFSNNISYSDFVDSILADISTDIYVETVASGWLSAPVSILSDGLTLSLENVKVAQKNNGDSNFHVLEAAYSIPTNSTPKVLTTITDAHVNKGIAYSNDISSHFIDTDGDVLTYSAVIVNNDNTESALSTTSWLSIDESTGILSGTTPDSIGSINVKVSAKDSSNNSVSGTYTLAIGFEEFQTNTISLNKQRSPDIATLDDGSFVVTWYGYKYNSFSNEVFAQRFDTAGNKIGAEIQINTYTQDVQQTPSIASLNGGGFVISWKSGVWDNDNDIWVADEGQDGSGSGIYSQRFDNNGDPVGTETQVNTYTQGDQGGISTAGLSNGGYIVTWESYKQDTDSWGIYAQRFDVNGTKVDNEFLVNTYITSYQSRSDVTALLDGGYIITWRSYGQDGDGSGIYAQRYDANGAKVDTEFLVNTVINSTQSYPSITTLVDGGYVITWNSKYQDGSYYGIYGQRYDADGKASGSEFQVNTYITKDQKDSSISSLNDGGFIVTWESWAQDGDNYGIYAQRFDVNSNKVGDEFLVNTTTDERQTDPAISSLADGGFVITWVSDVQDGSGYGIFTQRYDANSQRLGGSNNTYNLINDSLATEDELYTFDASINFVTLNPDSIVSYSASLVDGSKLPTWLGFDSSTGVFSGTPSNDDTGLKSITIVATNNTGTDFYDTFYLTVNNVNDAPTLTGDFNGSLIKGESVVTGSLLGDDVDEYQEIWDASNWTARVYSTDSSGRSVHTRTNTSGDSYVYTFLENEDTSAVSTYDYTLSNDDWHYQVKTTQINGDYTRYSTSSLGKDATKTYTYNEDGSRDMSSSGVWSSQGVLNYNVSSSSTEDSSGVVTSYAGVLYLDGRLFTSTMVGVEDNGDAIKVRTASTDLGIDYVIRVNKGLTYTIENQQGVYGSIALDEQVNWTYTLDYTDPDTIALTYGDTVIDSFTITVSDGIDTISQQVDVTVVGQNAVFNILTPTPQTIDTTNLNIDLTLDSDKIVEDALTSLGYTSVTGLTSSWNKSNNTLNLSFSSATHDSFSLIEHMPTISLDDIAIVDLTDVNAFAQFGLESLGYSDIVGLTSSWDGANKIYTIEVDSAKYEDRIINDAKIVSVSNSSGDIISYSSQAVVYGADPTLSQAEISEVVRFALGELGYSSIKGFTSNWTTSNDVLTISMDSAYLSGVGSGTSVSMVLDLNTDGSVNSYSGKAYSPSYGQWVYSTKSALTTIDLAVIKLTYFAIDALEKIGSQSTSNDVALIALKVLDYEQISGLTSSWDREDLTSTIEVDSAVLDGNVITNAKIIASINSSGNIDYYSSTGRVNNSYNFSHNQYDLNDAEEFVIEAGNYAMAKINGALQTFDKYDLSTLGLSAVEAVHEVLSEIDRVTSNHNFSNARETIIFDDAGNITSYDASIEHSDVGNIIGTIANLDASETNIIKDANTQINELENLVSSMQSAASMEDVAKVSLEYTGFSNLVNIEVNWDDDTSTATITFDGLFWGEERTNPIFTMTTGSDGELTAFSYTAGSPSGAKQLDLADLNETQLYGNKVVMKAISDLYDLEQAANHTSLLTNDISFDLYKDGSDTNQDLIIDKGELHINESFDFDTIKISDTLNYTQNINVTDAVAVLRHIVGLDTLDSTSNVFHAADVNNNDKVNVTDAVAILRNIVGLDSLDTFDLIDDKGARVTKLDPSATVAAPTWTIVANGDINMSGKFDDAYIVTSDLV